MKPTTTVLSVLLLVWATAALIAEDNEKEIERQEAEELARAKELELHVEDAGDGTASDWGLWLEPLLSR